MKNFKYIFTGLITVSALAMVSPVMAAEETSDTQTNLVANDAVKYDDIVKYDNFDLDDLLKNKQPDLPHKETEIKQTSYKDENTLELQEKQKQLEKQKQIEKQKQLEKQKQKDQGHPDRVNITGSNRNATGNNKEPGKVIWRNYRPGDLANFDIRTKNPSHITGAYIDRFLEKRGHYTPLKGYGDTILKLSNQYGINVGIFMGQIAMETTFGKNPGGGKYNFGCIRYYKNGFGSEWPPAYLGRSPWVNPPTVKDGIEVTYKLMRKAYADKGYKTYKAFINRYSPSFENNHIAFEQMTAGTMNALNIPY